MLGCVSQGIHSEIDNSFTFLKARAILGRHSFHHLFFGSQARACDWRIVISPKIPQDSPSCYDSVMRDLVVLFIHLIATLARLLGPGGARSIVAESLLLKHQLLMVNRPRHRSPNLCASDRILAGLMALLVRPTRLLRSAIVLKPSTLLGLHKALSQQKYRMLFSPNRRRKPGPKGPST